MEMNKAELPPTSPQEETERHMEQTPYEGRDWDWVGVATS